MTRTERETKHSFAAVIVGGGYGGLNAAVRLKQNGDDFILLEEREEVGGIWHDNQYPGAGCDVPQHLYSFSFYPYRDWKKRYPGQPEILQYLKDVVDKFGLRPHIATSTAVKVAEWSDQDGHWRIVTDTGDVYFAESLIFAVGQLHRPYIPVLPGSDAFNGSIFHTAKWDHNVALPGKQVAVIGTGSSAAQMIPPLAETCGHVKVFQRTPNHVLPKPQAQFGPVTRWLFRRVPALQAGYRALTWLMADIGLTPVIHRGWSTPLVRWLAEWHLRRRIQDPELRQKLTPEHQIGCKRIVIDSDYYTALNKANVELVTDRIERISEHTIMTADGVKHEADAIILATGFRASEFLLPIDVRGRDGISLQDYWKNRPEAYLGIVFPGFPNMFLVHGPNTILGHNSNVFIIECQVRYIMNARKLLQSMHGPAAIEIRPERMDHYRKWMERKLRRTVWLSGCQSWYLNDEKQPVNPWPESTFSYWRRTRQNPTNTFRPVSIGRAR